MTDAKPTPPSLTPVPADNLRAYVKHRGNARWLIHEAQRRKQLITLADLDAARRRTAAPTDRRDCIS